MISALRRHGKSVQQDLDEPEQEFLATFLDQQVSDVLKPVSIGFGVLYIVLAVSHGAILPKGPREVLMISAGISALIALAFAGRLHRVPMPPRWGHMAMAALMTLPIFNSALHIHLLAEPRQTTNLLITQIGIGLALLDRRWFAVATSTLLTVWVMLLAVAPPSPEWTHYGFALLSALIISIVLHVAHRRQLAKLAHMSRHNIQQQEQLEELVETAIATSRSKSRFIAHLSHELRTPLSAIIGFAKLLQKNRQDNLDDKQLRYLASISGSGHHLLGVINQVLDLSSLEANRLDLTPSRFSLSELATETLHELHPLAKEKGLELRLMGPARLSPLETDRNRLKQVLINLLGNAIKFTREGSVTLRFKGERQSLRPMAVVVQDTGPGIDPERLQTIFEPFEQLDHGPQTEGVTPPRGSGLGLAISRLLCHRLGFDLQVESTVGKGSKFTVELVDAETSAAPIPLDPEATGTLALVLKPNTDADGIHVQSDSSKEEP